MTNSTDPQKDSISSSERRDQETTNELEQLITIHLSTCSKCNPPFKPVKLGEPAGFCPDYWGMIQGWSDREGKINNVVAHDEYGNDAPRKLQG